MTSFGFDLQGTQMLAFTYVLSNDRSGVAVVTVPEPAALALLPAATALIVGRRRAPRQPT